MHATGEKALENPYRPKVACECDRPAPLMERDDDGAASHRCVKCGHELGGRR